MSAYLDQLPEQERTSFLDLGDHDACLDWITAVARSLNLVNLDYEDHGLMLMAPIYEVENAIDYASCIKADSEELQDRPVWCGVHEHWEWPYSCPVCAFLDCAVCPECGGSGTDHKPAGSPESRFDHD